MTDKVTVTSKVTVTFTYKGGMLLIICHCEGDVPAPEAIS